MILSGLAAAFLTACWLALRWVWVRVMAFHRKLPPPSIAAADEPAHSPPIPRIAVSEPVAPPPPSPPTFPAEANQETKKRSFLSATPPILAPLPSQDTLTTTSEAPSPLPVASIQKTGRNGKGKSIEVLGGVAALIGAATGSVIGKGLSPSTSISVMAGALVGVVCALIPYFYGRRKHPTLANRSFWICGISGAILGVLLALPVSLALTGYIAYKTLATRTETPANPTLPPTTEAPAKSTLPATTTPTPDKFTSGCGIVSIVIAGLCILVGLLSQCDDSATVPSRTAPPENSTPERDKTRAESQTHQTPAEIPKAPTREEKPIEAPAPTLPEQPTIEQQRTQNRGRAKEQFNAGRDYGQQERFIDAAAAFRRAVEIDPSYASAWYNLGWVFAKLGNSKDAISAFEKAVSIQPDLKDGWYSLAAMYAALDKAENVANAIVHLRKLDFPRAQNLTRSLTAEFVQRLAVAEYPALGVESSPLNREFAKRYHRYKASNPRYFDNTDWPIVLAQEAARAIGSR